MGDQIAFLGLGNMGQAMTRNLAVKGKLEKPIILYNRTQVTALNHSATIGHSRTVEHVEDAVSQSDIIWTCLSDQEAVLSVFNKILATTDIRDKLFVDSSTIAADVTDSIHERLLRAGADFVAMPVFGEPTLANKGHLICVLAGSTVAIQRIKPYLVGIVARALIELPDENPGKASLLKLVGNTFILNTMEMVAEGLVFADKTGLGTSCLHRLIETMFPIGPALVYSNRMRSGEYFQGQPMVEVRDARKLSKTVMDTAKAAGVQLPAYQVAVDHLAVVEHTAGRKADITGIYGANRKESGLTFGD